MERDRYSEYEEELLREALLCDAIEGPIKRRWFETGRFYEQSRLHKRRKGPLGPFDPLPPDPRNPFYLG